MAKCVVAAFCFGPKWHTRSKNFPILLGLLPQMMEQLMNYSRKAILFLKSKGLDNPCRFMTEEQVHALTIRSTAHWHSLFTGRHIGIHRPDGKICNWTARILSKDKLYRQKCLGSAIDFGNGSIDYRVALSRAFEWYDTDEVKAMATTSRPVGRVRDVNICPIGDVYSVGHAVKDYCDWTRLARSVGVSPSVSASRAVAARPTW